MRGDMLILIRIFAAAALVIAPLPAFAQTIFVKGARVITAGPQGVIENGGVLMKDGLIVGVGAGLTPPADATVIDAAGRTVTPGIFAAYSTLGLEELDLDAEANDVSTRDDFPMSAALDAADAFNPTSTLIAINRAGGITRALAAPEPGSKLFGGRAAVVDLSGRIASVTLPRAAQNVVMGYAGASRTGDSRLAAWATLRDYLDEARAYATNPREYKTRARDNDMNFADLEALGPAADGRQPMIVAANGAVDIRNLIRLKTDYRLNVVVLGGAEAWRVARELAATNTPVIIDPAQNLPSAFEDLGATLDNARRLNEAGVKIAFYNPDGGPTHNLRLLTQQAGIAVAHGLPYDAAIAALTINPATMYGLQGKLGSLEPGKAGDLVIWDGDPLEVTTRAVAVFIDGRAMSMQNRQTKMLERYRSLDRGDLPFAYRGKE